MSQTRNVFGLLLLTLSLTGCVVAIGNGHGDGEDNWKERQGKNSRYINSLSIGASRAVVESDLGSADILEVFQRNGDDYRVLFYRTQRVNDDGRTTKNETTPLVFIDDKLVGWGDTAIEKATR
jgi:hypothetical protein